MRKGYRWLAVVTLVCSMAGCGVFKVVPPEKSESQLVNMGFEEGLNEDGLPTGWRHSANEVREAYRFELDDEVSHSGATSYRIAYGGPDDIAAKASGVPSFGLEQCTGAEPYVGADVRYSGFLKSSDIRRSKVKPDFDGEGSLVFKAIDAANKWPGFGWSWDDSNKPKAYKVVGTLDWAEVATDVFVPEEAVRVCISFELSGEGTLWVDDLKVERADA